MDLKDLQDYLEERIKSVDECYEKELPLMDVGEGHRVINITGLSKKEREEVINKRNCLIIQKLTYQEVLDKIRGEDNG